MMQKRTILEKTAREFDFFTGSPPIDEEILLHSLYPPLPVAGTSLLWGFRILEAAIRLDVEELRVAEIEGEPADFLCVALKLENRRDNYSWEEMEKIAGFIRYHECSSRIAEIEALIQTTGSFLKRADVFAKLPPGPKSLVLSGFADLRTAGRLRNFPETACRALIDNEHILSTSEKRKLVSFINETGLRDNLDQPAVEKLVRDVISSEEPVKAAYTIRYPTLAGMENIVNNFHNRYVRGTGLQVTMPPGFEGESIQVSFRCRSKKELIQRVEHLQKITGKTDELFDLLF